jgi:hypothetical protein
MFRRASALATVFSCVTLCAIFTHAADAPVDSLAEEYVKLVLRVGRYVPNYVDAYIGPVELKEAAAREEVEKGFPYQRLCFDAEQMLTRISEQGAKNNSETDKQRLVFMGGQINALRGVLDMHRSKSMSFDQEVTTIYGVQAPRHDSVYYDNQLIQLDSLVPGKGDLADRYRKFRRQFIVSRHLIDTLLKVCISECRERTSRFTTLPEGEHCRIELVGGQSWGGYNWFLGDLQSLIQFDTTSEPFLESLVDLVAHEGYPGHHLAAVVRESRLVRDNGCVEHSVFPLFCPQSVLDEGTASFAPELVLPLADRVAFYKQVVFPILQLDTNLAEPYCRVSQAAKNFDVVALDVARLYFDGTLDSAQTIRWLCRYTLATEDEALRSLAFADDYGSYLVTYTVGANLVRDYLTRHGGTPDNPQKRWGLYYSLLAEPRLPSSLQ